MWQSIGFLNRKLCTCSKELKELSYKQFVLPVLDYASSIWDPYHQNQINRLEIIYHRAAHFIMNEPWRRNVVLLRCYHLLSGQPYDFIESVPI